MLLSGNKLEGDMVCLVSNVSVFSVEGEFTCIEHIDKSENKLRTSP